MRGGDLGDDREPEADAAAAAGVKAAKYFAPLFRRNTRTAVQHAQRRRRIYFHFDGAAEGRMGDGVVEQVLHGKHDSRAIARDRRQVVGRIQGELDAAADRQRCTARDRFGGGGAQVDGGGDIERRAIQPRHGQHLLEQPPHPIAVGAQRGRLRPLRQFIDARDENRERRAQRMCGVADEAAMRLQRALHPVERGIDGADQWRQLAGQAAGGKTHVRMPRPHPRGRRRRLAQRPQPVPDGEDGDAHRHQRHRHQQPQRAEQELAQQAFDQPLLLLVRLRHHHPPRTIAHENAEHAFRVRVGGRHAEEPRVARPIRRQCRGRVGIRGE
jgi:hypothetical protein